jgi:RNA polymerase sigma factor for flagellar operon FliA
MSAALGEDEGVEGEGARSEARGGVRRLPLTGEQRELVVSALDVVDEIARRLASRPRSRLTEDELVSEGHVALVQAAQSFDASRGATFATFAAYRVKGAMLNAIQREASFQDRLVCGAHLDAWEFLSGQGGPLEGDPLRDTDADHQARVQAFSDWLLASMFAGLVARLVREGGEDGLAAREAYARAVKVLREERAEMNDREQRFLLLYYDEMLPMARVAEDLGISLASAKRYQTTVLGRLAARLKRRGIVEAAEEEP